MNTEAMGPGQRGSWVMPVLTAVCGGMMMVAACISTVTAGALPSKPNIIFILTDDQGYGDVSRHGNPVLKTPHMDSLAESGVRFENFVVSPSCSPTRCALMTGMHEFKSGVTHTIMGRDSMSLESVTVADVLKRGGYATGLFGKWHLGMGRDYLPEKRGFDVAMTTKGDSQRPHFNPTMVRNGKEESHEGFRTDILFREAIKFIDGNKKGPFFCYLSTYSPHAPLVAPDEYVNRYKGKVTDEQAAFMGMVANIDDNIGKLLTYLGESGLERDTIVILMNDNGGTYGVDVWNAGMRGHKGNAWHGATRALSFWRWPGILKPCSVEELAGHVDLLPTLAELAGVELDSKHRDKLDGISLTSLLTGGASPNPERMIITNVGRWQTGHGASHQHALCGVHYQQYHLVINAPCAEPFCRGECRFSRRIMKGTMEGGYSSEKLDFNAKVTPVGQWQLHDVHKDLAQEQDIASQHPGIVTTMSEAYDAWWKEVSVDWPRVMERTFEGKLLRLTNVQGKVTNDYLLKRTSGTDIALKQPGVHEGYGWTKDRVPDLVLFADSQVKIKALAYEEAGKTDSVIVERVTAVESMDP